MLLLASISALCLCRINDLHVYSMQCNVDIRIYIYIWVVSAVSIWYTFQQILFIGSQENSRVCWFCQAGPVDREFSWFSGLNVIARGFVYLDISTPEVEARSRLLRCLRWCVMLSKASCDRTASSQWPTMSSVVLEDLQYGPQVTSKGWQKTWSCYRWVRCFLCKMFFLKIVVWFRCGWGKMEMFAFLPPSLRRTSRVVGVR